MSDSNVDAVREKMKRRELAGFDKYGVSTDRTDLSAEQWLQHLQEELMDACVYTERMLKELSALRERVAELEEEKAVCINGIKAGQKRAEKAARERDEARAALARVRERLRGWRENDWPEGFDRRTAELLVRYCDDGPQEAASDE